MTETEANNAAGKAKNGWAWIARDSTPPRATKVVKKFDGTYIAPCPACGDDVPWSAFLVQSLCDCGGAS